MAEDEVEKTKSDSPEPLGEPAVAPRRFFTARKVLTGLGILAISIVIACVMVYVLYRAGTFDRYIKDQLVAKLSDIGIKFESETFRVAASPMTVELRNATFRDNLTGEKLFFVREARLGLTVLDLLSWRLSRDIRIDRSDIAGAEVWVNFDENGRSNFANLKLVENQKGSPVNFRYDSVQFSIQDSVFHYGDVSRSIGGDARNVTFELSPDSSTSDEKTRFKFEFNSKDSNFKYEDKTVEKIDIRATGIADDVGADVSNLTLKTPVGDSVLSGTIRDWASPKYELDIASTVDITQIASIFSTGTALAGVGNFKGHVSGSGETYRVEGSADSESLRAGGVYLKALDVAATVEGTNTNYTANGKAVAEMLTFEDFKVDFPKLVGSVRGTGTDFRWVGELQAIAARSPALTLGGLFLSDAVAEYKDRKFRAEVGNGRAKRFAVGDIEMDDLRARGLSISTQNGGVDISAPSGTAGSLVSKDYRLDGVAARNLRVKKRGGETTVEGRNITSRTAAFGKNKVTGVNVSELKVKNKNKATDISVAGLRADRVDSNGTRIEGVESPLATLQYNDGTSVIYADKLRVAKIDTNSAVLGNLNIGGVRLTIRNGTVEGRSNDIDAGRITLAKSKQLENGGTLDAVKFNKPVFIVEPSGRYRATADMSIGGGTVGSVSLGSASAKVSINNDRALLDQLNASVMDGSVNGSVEIALNARSESKIDATFTELDLSKLAALQSGRVIAIAGKTTGHAHLTFPGTDFRSASGQLDLDISANAGSASSTMPINGKIDVTADKGLFTIASAHLNTANSELAAAGRFDLRDNDSNLQLTLNSADASEIRRLIQITGALPAMEQQFESLNIEFAGNMKFAGTVTGNLLDPNIQGKIDINSFIMRQRDVGSVSTDLVVNQSGVEIRNGKLAERLGGTTDFEILIPYGGSNNTTVTARLSGISAGDLLAALPVDLPDGLSDFSGKTSGTVAITGLPNNAQGNIDISAANGSIAGQTFDTLAAKAVFHGTRIDLESGEIHLGSGFVTAKGSYDRESSAFDLDIIGKQVPVPLVLAFLPKNDSIPTISGLMDLTAKAVGQADRPATFDVHFDGVARQVLVGESPLGDLTINGKTENNVLTANLTANLDGRNQVINAEVHFDNDNLPFKVTTSFDQTPLSPYLAFVPQLKNLAITGTGTGRIEFGGNLRTKDANGVLVYDSSTVSGTALFDQLALNIQDTPLTAVEPLSVKFNRRELVFEKAKFAGGGSNMTVSGTKALSDDAVNNLEVNGNVSLNLLNLANSDMFFSGIADVSIHLTGTNNASRLSGTASTENASVATFVGSDRLTFERVKTRVIFTANEAEIEQAKGYLGGGVFNANGGAILKDLSVQSFRFALSGDNITVPLPKDFLTTGDAHLEFSGRRLSSGDNLQMTVSGRVFARRILYSKDIDLANLVSARRDTVLSTSSGSMSAIRYDLVIEGRDALVVKNNIADLTASLSLVLNGDSNDPRITGRITATSGTILFRKDRYEVQRATLEFPPDTSIDPIINLQAESEIAGYQVFVNLSGPLKDSELLSATVRSSPALPQADVVSLITTGSLSNAVGGIPTIAQTGINTAAEILTDSIINNPARKATDKLFGLNVFEIDPIISGQQLNPSARLTVGRQINNNLRVTYSTNLSQDQNQVLALEYRVSNKLSFVAQYEQRSLSNVTRNRDNFSFEIRFRKRF